METHSLKEQSGITVGIKLRMPVRDSCAVSNNESYVKTATLTASLEVPGSIFPHSGGQVTKFVLFSVHGDYDARQVHATN